MEYLLYLQALDYLRAGFKAFSPEVNYMSLEGMARLIVFWTTGVWV